MDKTNISKSRLDSLISRLSNSNQPLLVKVFRNSEQLTQEADISAAIAELRARQLRSGVADSGDQIELVISLPTVH